MALEAGSSTLAMTRIREPHVARVVVANTKKLRQISHAKAKTDTLDARARRAQLVRQRTRAKKLLRPGPTRPPVRRAGRSARPDLQGGRLRARHVLCEAAKVAARTPGPLRGFAQRIRARRGTNVATIAVARKLCVIFWHLLTRGEDYSYARPSLTAAKLRRLELLAGAPAPPGPAR